MRDTYARGDATKDSINLLIVLEGEVIPGEETDTEEIDMMMDIVTEMNLYGVLLFIRIQQRRKGGYEIVIIAVWLNKFPNGCLKQDYLHGHFAFWERKYVYSLKASSYFFFQASTSSFVTTSMEPP